ncbi:hypothetical protein [Salinarimonas ramus]|uniref:Uncharacterized protein n=1 Tax=Salinarimonas ramus TaxID=690164 RepID=A0A917V465_9HYPH|nr:hypothetical protein [Salinarimonas ramus]GGK34824.1 hypothetical protein GCM10011322_21990 [Salinarimonas ramus]
MHALSRLVFWLVGLVLAIPAGAIALALGVLNDAAARETIGRVGLAAFAAIFRVAAAGGDPAPMVETMVLGFWMLACVLVVAPVTLVSALGEIAGARSLVLYGGLTATLTAGIPWLLRGGAGDPAALAAEGRLTAILFVTGAVAGLVYWVVSGRSAGRESAQ